MNYIMIPKEVIYCLNKNEKRVHLFSYFSSKRGLDDTVGFSCNDVVKWIGCKIDYHKDKTNDQITELIHCFERDGYFKLEENILANNFVKATLNTEKFDVYSKFALVYLHELDKIHNFKKYTSDINRMSSSILLLVLSYIRVNMLRRQAGYFNHKSDKPEFCYRMYKDIETDIGISSRYISRSVKILCELDLIATSTLPRYKDESGNWHTEVTLFVNKYKYKDDGGLDDSYDYRQELIWGKEYIQEKKFLSKKFGQDS